MFWNKPDLSSHIDYKEAQSLKIKSATPLESLSFTVLDTETTGFNFVNDKVISIGALQIINEELVVERSQEWNFDFEAGTEKEHISIHQITPGETHPSEKKQIAEFLRFIGNSILVGHNVSFDISMLNEVILRHFNFRLQNHTLDTAKLAIRLDHGTNDGHYKASDYGLDELCRRFQIAPHDRHHAAGDAFITGLLLLQLLRIARSKKIRTKGQLLKKSVWL